MNSQIKNVLTMNLVRKIFSDLIKHYTTFSNSLLETMFRILLIMIKKVPDTTIIKNCNNGGHLVQQWNIKCSYKNDAEKKENLYDQQNQAHILQI